MKKHFQAHLAAIRHNVAAATLIATGALVPGVGFAQPTVGDLAQSQAAQFAGLTYLLKLGAAFVGVAMVCYSVYGLTMGRKQDSREYPVGQMAAIGLGGAILTSIAFITGVLNGTVLQSNQDSNAATSGINLSQ